MCAEDDSPRTETVVQRPTPKSITDTMQADSGLIEILYIKDQGYRRSRSRKGGKTRRGGGVWKRSAVARKRGDVLKEQERRELEREMRFLEERETPPFQQFSWLWQ